MPHRESSNLPFHLRVSRDECGEPIIRGKRGHLYVDAGALCAMWTDAPPIMQFRLAKLGGARWQGDISRGANGRRVQDAAVRGIQPEGHRLAIRLVGAKPRRVLSPAHRKALEKARLASPLISIPTVQDGSLRASIASEALRPWFGPPLSTRVFAAEDAGCLRG